MKSTIPTYPKYLQDEFSRNTREFQLEILHDDGPYRHLTFGRPGSSMGRFELVTWPRHLSIGGDWEGFVFARLEDMFQLFRSPSGQINPDYWAEKIVAGRHREKAYSQELVERRIWNAVRQAYEYGTAPKGLAKAVQEEIVGTWEDPLCAWDTAQDAIQNFKHRRDGVEFHFGETWAWDTCTYTGHYLLVCHAIVAMINAYDACKRLVEAPDDAHTCQSGSN